MDIKGLFGFEGKNVVITGAGSGMGYAGAKLLTELEANVYATVRRKAVDFPVTKEIKVDLGTPAGIEALVSEVPDEIEALFICHAVANAQGNTNALGLNLTNFFSYKCITEKLLPRINDGGSVTFISSNGGRQWRESIAECLEVIDCSTWDEAVKWYEAHPDATNGGYVFSKKCQNVYVMSKVHAPEFIERKIRLNAIAPGMTLTGLTNDFNSSINGDAEYGKELLEKHFLEFWNGRWASPDEMGHPLVAVGSRLFSYMSGQIIYIDYGTSSLADFKEL